MGYATGQLMRLALPPRLEAGVVLQGSGVRDFWWVAPKRKDIQRYPGIL